MWGRELDGIRFTFHLAGINNQNFLMRDEETGTYWQQITGRAVSGPLAGKTLPFVPSDELTFALWKAEEPQGMVLKDVAAYASEYSPKDWDVRMRKAPTVLSYARPGLAPRDVMFGIEAFGAARAFPAVAVSQKKLVLDHVGGEPVMLVVGPDDQSVRAFRVRLAGAAGPIDFYRVLPASPPGSPAPGAALMIDSATGSKWDFSGCAIEGPRKGACLEHVRTIRDYWFDWRHYHPDTTVFGIAHQ